MISRAKGMSNVSFALNNLQTAIHPGNYCTITTTSKDIEKDATTKFISNHTPRIYTFLLKISEYISLLKPVSLYHIQIQLTTVSPSRPNKERINMFNEYVHWLTFTSRLSRTDAPQVL